jgi:hypothetical protein
MAKFTGIYPSNTIATTPLEPSRLSRALHQQDPEALGHDKILKRWGMETCNPLPTPFPAKADAIIDELSTPIDNPDPQDIKQFQELVGQLLYCKQNTVPEIAWVVSLLARCMTSMTKAGPAHLQLGKKVFATSKGAKRCPFDGALRTAKHHIIPAKPMAMLMPASQTSGLIASLAWATSSSSITALLAGVLRAPH